MPQSYTVPDGFPLGQLVSNIRSQHDYIKGHPERRTWLQERGWVENELDAKWEDVQRYLGAYFDKNGDLRVPQSYTVPDGFPLGQLVSNIRSQHDYIKGHPERRTWLQERGWVENELDAKWEDVQRYLQAYFDKKGDLRVPRSYTVPDGFPLGQLVSHIRSRHDYIKGHPERRTWLKAHGFKMHARNAVEDAKRWVALEV